MSSDAKVLGYCRACGKPLDETTVRTAHGTIYCEEHLPMEPTPQSAASAGASPYTATPYTASPYTSAAPPPVPNADVSPGLAFGLGLIPGVGAIYNGQYAKGLVHVIIVGLMISILGNGGAQGLEPLLSLLLAGFWAYMAFEAYHTARRRQQGLMVDEFSSLIPMRGGASRFPAAPVMLMALGVFFLLDNLGLLEIHRMLRYWPVLLIALGAYMLYVRMSGATDPKSGGER